jgi:hypothetical protein
MKKINRNALGSALFYLWLFFFPWQTKLIISPAVSNFWEIAWMASWILLLASLLILPGFKLTKLDFKSDRYLYGGAILSFIAALISVISAPDKPLAIFHVFIFFLALSGFFFLKNQTGINRRLAARFFIAGLAVASLLGIFQFYWQSAPADKWLGLASHQASTAGTAVIELPNYRFLRAYASFDHPNEFGGLAFLALLLIIYFLPEKDSRRERLLYEIAWPLILTGGLLSFSRAAFGAALVAAPFLIIRGWRQGDYARRFIKWLGVITAAVLIIVVVPNYSLFLSRGTIDGRLEQKSITDRETYFNQSLRLIKTHPLGTGIGNYTLALTKNGLASADAWQFQPVHNYWLLTWAELGFLGLLGLISFWYGLWLASKKNQVWPFMIFFIILSVVDHWLWSWTSGTLFFFLFWAGSLLLPAKKAL